MLTRGDLRPAVCFVKRQDPGGERATVIQDVSWYVWCELRFCQFWNPIRYCSPGFLKIMPLHIVKCQCLLYQSVFTCCHWQLYSVIREREKEEVSVYRLLPCFHPAAFGRVTTLTTAMTEQTAAARPTNRYIMETSVSDGVEWKWCDMFMLVALLLLSSFTLLSASSPHLHRKGLLGMWNLSDAMIVNACSMDSLQFVPNYCWKCDVAIGFLMCFFFLE